MKKLKIILADDHQVFREGLLSLLENNPNIESINDFENGNEAWTHIKDIQPDIAILDISMPGKNGFEILSKVALKELSTKVIFLTMHKDVKVIDRAMSEGAHGYLLKDEAFEQLLSAIKAVSQGKKYLSIEHNSDLATYRLNKEDQALTSREKEIIYLISNGLSNKEVAKKLCISPKTVDTHRTRLMKKLNLHKSTDLVRYAIKEGLDI